MATVEQSVPAASQLGSTLRDAISVLSANETVTFTKYIRLVLPYDGYVFWVKADLLSSAAALNWSAFDTVSFDAALRTVTPAPTLEVAGSFHYAVEQRQAEDETLAVNRVVFTTPTQIQYFEKPNPSVLWLGSVKGFRFAFSATRNFYTQAGLWHYIGDAIYPALESQIVDDPAAFDTQNLVVSNSLPVWLGLPHYIKPYDDGLYPPDFPFYPSFLIPDDAVPPYCSVHIASDGMRALQSAPLLGSTLSHSQLATDHVRLTFYGLRNFTALNFQDFLFQYSMDTEAFGVMGIPIVRDEKRTQTELGVIAMKKTFELDVSYYQGTVRNIARAYIKSCIPSFTFPFITAAGFAA